ncbi:MAG: helix-turn-helix domain-containing protein, partial [Myxococcota bacterium]
MALSKDLRQRVVTAYHDGEGTYDELAERFDVNRNTVWSWVKLEKETGSLEPRTANNGRPKKLSDIRELLRTTVVGGARLQRSGLLLQL